MRTFILFLLVFAVSCKPSGEQKSETVTQAEQEHASSITAFEGPAAILLQQLREQGDYVNSRQFPSMIKPETVYNELGQNNLILDLRNAERFEMGHIKGAINVPMDKLLSYFENDIIPFQYDKD